MDLTGAHVVFANLEAHGCKVELYVNGFPIAIRGPDVPRFASTPVEHYLVQGSNEVELLVEPVTRPSRARTEATTLARPSAWARGRLVRFPDGVSTEIENGTILVEVTWHGGGPSESFPQTRAGTVALRGVGGRWSWQDAPPLTLDDTLVAEAVGVLEATADAIRRNAKAEYLALIEIQARDALRAYPMLSPALPHIDLMLASARRCRDPVRPLVRERHDFRLVAGGHVLECIDADGGPSLRLTDPEQYFPEMPYPIFLARIDGRLRVVR